MKRTKLTATVVTGLVLLMTACGSPADESSSGDIPDEQAEVSVPSSDATPADEPADTPADDAEPATAGAVDSEAFPEVTGVEATTNSDGTWNFDVTVSSPYDSPEQYADAWRILDEDGNELGIRELTHDHASEQPFTRNLSDVEIPEDVTKVMVEGRDLINGWSGQTFAYNLPGASSY